MEMTCRQPGAVGELLDPCYALLPGLSLHLLNVVPSTLTAVKEKLRLDPDSEIATTGVRVSLICPVSPCKTSYSVFFCQEILFYCQTCFVSCQTFPGVSDSEEELSGGSLGGVCP